MQDEYVRAFEKLQIGEERKLNMRKILESELAASRKPAKTTRLTSGSKAGIAAAAVTITLAGAFVVPASRNTIMAAIKSVFYKEIPVEAVDQREKVKIDRETRVIPTDIPEASEIRAVVAEQDRQEDEMFSLTQITSEDIKDQELKNIAKSYEDQDCTLSDLKKSIEYDLESGYAMNNYSYKDDIEEGFTVNYQVGDNAYGHMESISVFKISEEGLEKYLFDESRFIQRLQPFDMTPEEADALFVKSEDDEGNIVYTASVKGPEPEVKHNDSDRAVFMDYEITYNPTTQIASVFISQGGGVG